MGLLILTTFYSTESSLHSDIYSTTQGFIAFLERDGPSMCLQKHATGAYPEPAQSTSHTPFLYFNIILVRQGNAHYRDADTMRAVMSFLDCFHNKGNIL
jgi:hypothetical protein